METSEFTLNGEIRHKLKRPRHIYIDNFLWTIIKEQSNDNDISISELIVKILEKELILNLKKRED